MNLKLQYAVIDFFTLLVTQPLPKAEYGSVLRLMAGKHGITEEQLEEALKLVGHGDGK